jgi:peroxiredoxin
MKKYLFIGGTMAALVALALTFNTSLQANGQVVVDKPAIDFTLSDITGKKVSLSDYKGKYVVLEWINYDCPFVAKHYNSGNMQALQKKYMDKGVVWLAVCSSAPGKQGHFSTAEIQNRLKQHASTPTSYLLDTDGRVGQIYGATNTPHMYIVNPAGTLIYMGAIDDKPTANRADIATARNYVQAALDAAMAGQAVPVKATKAYGCTVKYP